MTGHQRRDRGTAASKGHTYRWEGRKAGLETERDAGNVGLPRIGDSHLEVVWTLVLTSESGDQDRVGDRDTAEGAGVEKKCTSRSGSLRTSSSGPAIHGDERQKCAGGAWRNQEAKRTPGMEKTQPATSVSSRIKGDFSFLPHTFPGFSIMLCLITQNLRSICFESFCRVCGWTYIHISTAPPS